MRLAKHSLRLLSLLTLGAALGTVLGLVGCSPSPQPVISPTLGFAPAKHHHIVPAADGPIEVVCRKRSGPPCPITERLPNGSRRAARPPEGEMLLAAGFPAPSGGYRLHFTSVWYTEVGDIVAAYTVEQPGPTCVTPAILTFPNAVVRVPLSDRPVRFIQQVETYSCEERP